MLDPGIQARPFDPSRASGQVLSTDQLAKAFTLELVERSGQATSTIKLSRAFTTELCRSIRRAFSRAISVFIKINQGPHCRPCEMGCGSPCGLSSEAFLPFVASAEQGPQGETQ